MLVYRGVEAAAAAPTPPARCSPTHGWGGTWVDGVFDFHHFHSTSHEVLAVVAGRATLELGGPQGEAFEVAAGDVLVLPAGTGHRRATARDGFTVVGAYPAGPGGLRPAARRRPGEVEAARERIAALRRRPTTRSAAKASPAGLPGSPAACHQRRAQDPA